MEEDRQSVNELKLQKQEESLQEIPLIKLAENVIKDYEKLLYDALIINGSFKDILDKKIKPFKRITNWIFLAVYIGFLIPRFSFICFLYLKDDDTRLFWQYYLTDYFEELGMFGRCLNFCYLVFTIAVVLDKFWLHFFETNGRLDFLTNFLTLIPEEDAENQENQLEIEPMEPIEGPNHRQDHINHEDVLSEEDMRQLLIRTKNYIKLCRVLCRISFHACHCYDYLCCPLFIYRRRPSIPVAVMAGLNMIIILFAVKMTITHCITIYTSFLITVEYFKARLRFLMSKLKQMKATFEEQVVCQVISLYMRLMLDFKRQDLLLKHLLRNLLLLYMVELSLLFFLLTLDVHPLLRTILITAPLSLAVSIVTTGLFIGQLHSKTMDLYLELNHSMANNSIDNVSLKSRRQLLLAIKELVPIKWTGSLSWVSGMGLVRLLLHMRYLT